MMEILFQNKDLIVVIKPVGVDSEQVIPQMIQNTVGGEIYPVHRLDQNVGGVMLYARTKYAASVLSRSVQEGDIIKEYVALVHGELPAEGCWEDLLFKDGQRNKVYVVKKERKGVKRAVLQFQSVPGAERSFAHIRLHTGRSHQIRVQFSSRGYPLVGDHKYGSRAKETEPFLYSCRVTFPWKGQYLSFSSLPQWAEKYVPAELPGFDKN